MQKSWLCKMAGLQTIFIFFLCLIILHYLQYFYNTKFCCWCTDDIVKSRVSQTHHRKFLSNSKFCITRFLRTKTH